jgi:hypothetical protein
MTYTPSAIAFDFETCLVSGEPTLDMYSKDARINSSAFAWRGECGTIKTKVTWTEEETRGFLERCINLDIPLVVHNYSFEYLCMKCRFPDLNTKSENFADTMRLSQMVDNGGKQFVLDFQKDFEDLLAELSGIAPMSGLGLEACVSRLGNKERYKHKEPFKQLMLKRGGSTSSFDLLTKEELGEYNALDAIVTLELYEKTTETLKTRGIDWKPDHELYTYMCEITTQSRIRGVKIDQELLDEHIQLKQKELQDIEATFREYFKNHIDDIELELWDAKRSSYKTEAKRDTVEKPRFNINSTKQLSRLFVDKLGIKAQFFTKKGAPTFSSKLLFQWGEGGELLKNRGKASIELAQGESLKALSEPDGRWHVSIKVAGTKSGRMAGGV